MKAAPRPPGPAPSARPARMGPPSPRPVAALAAAFSMARYRFFLLAGLLPYFLGAAWACAMEGRFDGGMFRLGLLGILFSVIGVEAFNEYFDSRMGTDRVFNPEDEDPIPGWVLGAGLAAFAAAAACGALLARKAGWPVFLYMILGGQAAAFYVGPPVRWVYRGLGEVMIALSYGPWMTLGSASLHTGRAFSGGALAASLVPGLLVASLAVVNAIPDYHQDRLVGKRNLVVRLGRRGGVLLYGVLSGLGLAAAPAGALAGLFPPAAALAAAAGAPLWWSSLRRARVAYDAPRLFIPAVRSIVLCYVAATSVFTAAVWLGGPR